MRNQIIAHRYAKALIDIAVEQNQLDAVVKDIEFIRASNTKEFNAIMLSPVYSDAQKTKLFKAVFGGKISEITLAFFNLVFSKSRELIFGEIAVEFIEQYRKIKGIEILEITTAVEISDELKEGMRKRFSGLKRFENKQLQIVTKVKPEIIGGFVAKTKDLMFDASIKHDLQIIGKQFIENMYVHKIR